MDVVYFLSAIVWYAGAEWLKWYLYRMKHGSWWFKRCVSVAQLAGTIVLLVIAIYTLRKR